MIDLFSRGEEADFSPFEGPVCPAVVRGVCVDLMRGLRRYGWLPVVMGGHIELHHTDQQLSVVDVGEGLLYHLPQLETLLTDLDGHGVGFAGWRIALQLVLDDLAKTFGVDPAHA